MVARHPLPLRRRPRRPRPKRLSPRLLLRLLLHQHQLLARRPPQRPPQPTRQAAPSAARPQPHPPTITAAPPAAPPPLPVTQPAQLARAPPSPSTAPPTSDWGGLWRDMARDHAHAGLVWNEATRAELRDALAAEAASLRRGRAAAAGGGVPVVWNHWECHVRYRTLDTEPCVGGVYVRLLVDGGDANAAALRAPPPRPGGQPVVGVAGGGGRRAAPARRAAATAARAAGARPRPPSMAPTRLNAAASTVPACWWGWPMAPPTRATGQPCSILIEAVLTPPPSHTDRDALVAVAPARAGLSGCGWRGPAGGCGGRRARRRARGGRARRGRGRRRARGGRRRRVGRGRPRRPAHRPADRGRARRRQAGVVGDGWCCCQGCRGG